MATEYTVRTDRDVGVTTLRGLECRSGAFIDAWTLQVAAHVGDLALVEVGEGLRLILETGAGDEGGDVLIYDVSGSPLLLWSGKLDGRARCLTIEIVDSARRQILFQAIDGMARVYRLESGELRRERGLETELKGIIVPVVTREGNVGHPGLIMPGARWSYRQLTHWNY